MKEIEKQPNMMHIGKKEDEGNKFDNSDILISGQ